MKIYTLNLLDSQKIFDECNSMIEMKMCYNNVANVVLNYLPLFNLYKGIKIAYGGVSLSPMLNGAYAKHCFFIHEDTVIDPTAMLWDEENQIREYVIARTFKYSEYMQSLSSSNGDVSLDALLRKDFSELMKNLQKENIFLVG